MYTDIINKMKLKGFNFEAGLTDEEIINIEEKYGLSFPNSLKEFYKEGLPIGEPFPNWKDDSEANIKKIKERIIRPYNGIVSDIKENQFWGADWPKYDTIDEKIKYFNDLYNQAPRLIPIAYSRYIISTPETDEPAILSVHDSDIIVYGNNLKEYLENEFLLDHNNRHKTEFLPYMGKWIDIMDAY